MARPNILLLSILLIATISVVALAEDCGYSVMVRTGTGSDSGTDAVIGVTLANKNGEYIQINDLVAWGGRWEPGHDYFESGDVDLFIGRERCLSRPPCFLTLRSDGSGNNPGWYVDYVDVYTSAPVPSVEDHQFFMIDQWLALDEKPYELSTNRSNCWKSVESETRKSLYSIV